MTGPPLSPLLPQLSPLLSQLSIRRQEQPEARALSRRLRTLGLGCVNMPPPLSMPSLLLIPLTCPYTSVVSGMRLTTSARLTLNASFLSYLRHGPAGLLLARNHGASRTLKASGRSSPDLPLKPNLGARAVRLCDIRTRTYAHGHGLAHVGIASRLEVELGDTLAPHCNGRRIGCRWRHKVEEGDDMGA